MPGAARVLVAEDDRAIARLLQLVLEEEGCQVDWVREAHEILPRLQHEQYRLLILDQIGNHESELTDAARALIAEAVRHCPTVIITGRDWAFRLSEQERRTLARALGLAAILVKPFDLGDFLRLIHAALDPSQPPSSGSRAHNERGTEQSPQPSG
jgi:DNA-binding response OmpR family regulator